MAVRSVLVGRYAEASVGGVLIALLTYWKVEYSTKAIDTTAHGDTWERNIGGRSSWTFTAKGYIVPGSASHYLNQLWSSGAAPVAFTVAGFSGTVAAGTKIFEGSGIPVKGTIDAGMELATQDWEIKGDGAPSVGV